MTGQTEFIRRYSALPLGDFYAHYEGRRYLVTRTESEDGKRGWLYAKELGGKNHISFNAYRLSSGFKLKPCEMPVQKVTHFVLALEVEKT
jgi:hypothetical protein